MKPIFEDLNVIFAVIMCIVKIVTVFWKVSPKLPSMAVAKELLVLMQHFLQPFWKVLHFAELFIFQEAFQLLQAMDVFSIGSFNNNITRIFLVPLIVPLGMNLTFCVCSQNVTRIRWFMHICFNSCLRCFQIT